MESVHGFQAVRHPSLASVSRAPLTASGSSGPTRSRSDSPAEANVSSRTLSFGRASPDVAEAAVRAGKDLPLERPDPELAAEALTVSILTYAMFLEAAEGTMQHGLTRRVAQILAESPAFPGFPSPDSSGPK
jgi:hypothetical protein